MKLKIAIIGGGAAGLSAASTIDTNLYDVTLFERKNRLGSKLLVAGKGGFNLTHSEPTPNLVTRYEPTSFLQNALSHFTNEDLRVYFKNKGIETFIGSSKRIFPMQPQKPAEVVKAFIDAVAKNGVRIVTNAEWIGQRIEGKCINLKFKNNELNGVFDYVVYALGGGSWKITGSDGSWLKQFEKMDVPVNRFQASNCAVKIDWSDEIKEKIAGKPLKNIAVTINEENVSGELMVTDFGLEGTPIYALSKHFRTALNKNEKPVILVDFKPSLSREEILVKIDTPAKGNWTNHLKSKLNLNKEIMTLLKAYSSKAIFTNPRSIAKFVKAFPLSIEALAPIDEAISTVGGIKLTAVNTHFELHSHKNTFVIGEMLDWDAPTGGYLIQGCMSMGQYLAHYLNNLPHKAD